jgi:glucose/mannose transport system substrate-binding protein
MKATYPIIALVCVVILIGAVFVFTREPGQPEDGTSGTLENIIGDTSAGGSFRISHWWVIPVEVHAFEVARNSMNALYPNVSINPDAVTEGSGGMMPSYMLQGPIDAADVVQTHPGYEVSIYGSAKFRAMDDLWIYDNLSQKTPDLVEEMCKVGDHYYMVPIGAHRTNLVWYNKGLFEQAGVQPPTGSMTWDEFWTLCDNLKNELPGVNVLDLGDGLGTPWAAAQVFETMMAGLDLQTYEDFINGRVTEDQLKPVLENFKKLLSYVPQDHLNRNWAEACGKLYTGQVAMFIHGDWVNAYFKDRGWEYGEGYGAFPAPGTESYFGIVVDGFGVHKDAPHLNNALRWTHSIVTESTQVNFNPTKSSISPFLDVPENIYGDSYSRQTAELYRNSATKFYPSFVHGTALPNRVWVNLRPKIDEFVLNRNVDATASAIISELQKGDFTISWDIV